MFQRTATLICMGYFDKLMMMMMMISVEDDGDADDAGEKMMM